GSLATGRWAHTATLLPNGKVLVAGGYNGVGLASAELYHLASGRWSVTGNLVNPRLQHTAPLLPNGKLLVAGGSDTSAEFYDRASGTWTATGSLATERSGPTATLLPNGKVLVAGGFGLASAELYDVGLGFSSAWQPEIDTATLRSTSGHHLQLTGSLFQGVLQASGGNTQDSSSNYRSSSYAVSTAAKLFSSWPIRSTAGRRPALPLAGERLSFRPVSGDRLYQRHSEHGEVSGRPETTPLVSG